MVVMVLWAGLALGQAPPVPAPRPAERIPDAVETLADPAAAPATEPATDAGEPAGEDVPSDVPDGLDGLPPTTPAPPSAGTASEAAAALAVQLQPVHLTARVTEDGGNISQGLVWRVFDTHTDASGELALAAKSESAVADLELAPGDYVVHVAYGRAQASEQFTVVPGENDKAIVLDAGALRLNAAVAGDVPIPLNLLHFDIFTTTGGESDRTPLAEDVNPNDVITLNAGTYHVVSYFGAVNAVVRADLRVEPGQMTDALLYHRAAQVSFKLVTEAGGEAIADVEWTVKSAAGDTVFSNIGAFPATVLEEGDYTVFAKRGDTVYNRAFEVQAGPPQDVEVLTAVY
jgi:hypothetical protein